MNNSGGSFTGWTATGTGQTTITLTTQGEDALLVVRSRWMGQDPLHVTFRCRKHQVAIRYGVLQIQHAYPTEDEDQPYALPPSDGPIILEYVLLPEQQGVVGGSDVMRMVGSWNPTFSLVLWLHPHAAFDDGTQLDPDEYAPPRERFLPTVRALGWLGRVWKLAAT